MAETNAQLRILNPHLTGLLARVACVLPAQIVGLRSPASEGKGLGCVSLRDRLQEWLQRWHDAWYARAKWESVLQAGCQNDSL